jgi:tetratricopeptide (TPR) repeat protein
MMEDEHILKEIVQKQFPDLPYFMFGHSMGSFITRQFTAKYGNELAGAVYCGTAGPNEALKVGVAALEGLVAAGKGDEADPALGGALFASMTERFDNVKYGNEWVCEGLGYIWYYGRTGEVDYEKAFHYYSKAAELGNLRSRIKVADMYKNGYFVEKDYAKYTEIIEKSKHLVENARYLNEPFPEIYTRLAGIRKEQKRYEEAAKLYLQAKDFLAERILYTHFFGDRNVMKWLTEDLYTIIPFNETDFDLFDLYYLLKNPVTVTFRYTSRKYTVRSTETEEGTAVEFEGKWFRTIDDFFAKAVINGKVLTDYYRDLYAFEVVYEKNDM